ncbi:MAG: hypothetical protein K0U36_06300, partial [Alphaproteobacteria bacterium]|nr:hypothetical protein [Alphaproteobacteria bacterium]
TLGSSSVTTLGSSSVTTLGSSSVTTLGSSPEKVDANRFDPVGKSFELHWQVQRGAYAWPRGRARIQHP